MPFSEPLIVVHLGPGPRRELIAAVVPEARFIDKDGTFYIRPLFHVGFRLAGAISLGPSKPADEDEMDLIRLGSDAG